MIVRLAALLLLAAPVWAAPPDARARLADALDRYERIAAVGWNAVPEGPLVRPGEADAVQVPALRQRLAAEGELGRADRVGDTLDPALADALKRAQRRMGLDGDGIIGPKTRAALNVPATERAAQIRRAIDRAPTVPASGRFVLVNVAEYRVRAFEDGREVLAMKVVVGANEEGHRTPLFSDEIEYATFRPFWNIPTAIAVHELIPDGPEALAAGGYQLVQRFGPDAEVHAMTAENLQKVVDGHLLMRQAAGLSNALGLVKYMFPNGHNVYLHDTPARGYFGRDERALSHGCVRLQDPVAFGEWLLGLQGWTYDSVLDAMVEGEHQRVDLDTRVPVTLAYFPAWADESGAVWFAGDPYGLL